MTTVYIQQVIIEALLVGIVVVAVASAVAYLSPFFVKKVKRDYPLNEGLGVANIMIYVR